MQLKVPFEYESETKDFDFEKYYYYFVKTNPNLYYGDKDALNLIKKYSVISKYEYLHPSSFDSSSHYVRALKDEVFADKLGSVFKSFNYASVGVIFIKLVKLLNPDGEDKNGE
ncbi:27571_t:CDS:1 [Dentiscutata erythropus]|uniref:27571_t:CDS:1 n=1 Tax=Dentiscutata erythropus TaxID=1348616 RepID=A0A9N9DFK4_9GLOM|nr:27571_t:CDS:1 [Dentiscutata erythropus]